MENGGRYGQTRVGFEDFTPRYYSINRDGSESSLVAGYWFAIVKKTVFREDIRININQDEGYYYKKIE